MRVCIDPGHGLGNATLGVFDPGAVAGGVREADINLAVGLMLRDECARRGWSSVMRKWLLPMTKLRFWREYTPYL